MAILASALLAVGLLACDPASEAGSTTQPAGDTVAILEAAYRHHFADQQLDSVAVDVEASPQERGAVSERLMAEFAAELGLPVARESEVVWCSEALTVPRHCGLTGLKHLVMFGRPTIEGDRTAVWLNTWDVWVPGRLYGAGTQYELQRSPEGWKVMKVLKRSATN